MNSTTNNNVPLQRLPVLWVDSPVVGPLVICQRRVRRMVGTPRCGVRTPQRGVPTSLFSRLRAFTLLELMMVIAIIGFIAGMTLTHLGNFGHSNVMASATRQLQDDLALARQRAMVNRATVYMVFLPPEFWTNNAYYNVPYNQQETNLLMHQYSAYALVSLSSVGDQPGQHNPRYLTDWRFLPDGVFFSPFQFETNIYTNIYTTNTLSGVIVTNYVTPWNNNAVFPFPSLFPPNVNNMPLPCIGFTPQGSLTTAYTNQYISLARGSIFYPTDTNGVPLEGAANLTEVPPGNDVNNPNLLQIDWLTGRATLVQNQFQ